jgi:hypothetical protein
MGLEIIEADAENLSVEFLVCEDVVTKLAGLGCTTGCVILGIEIQDYPLVAIVFAGIIIRS